MKKNYAITVKAIVFICLVIFMGGCTTTMQLRYKKPPISELNKGEIHVVVDDQRLPDRGGDDPLRVGTVRNSFGMPFPLNTNAERAPVKVITELVTDCLMAAGYKVSAQATDETPQLHVALEAFWSDGYQHSRIGTTIPMELKRNKQSQPVWQHVFTYNIGVTWTAGYGPFNRGINTMLEKVKEEMILEFSNPKFHNSLKSM